MRGELVLKSRSSISLFYCLWNDTMLDKAYPESDLEVTSSTASDYQTSASSEVSRGQVKDDYFVERDGQCFAGTHVLLELWGAKNLTDPVVAETALRNAARAAGATVLHAHVHRFGPGLGVSGVVVLAESHISIHTWPEREFAALDIFMCGDCDPHLCVPVLTAAFAPERTEISDHKRGLMP